MKIAVVSNMFPDKRYPSYGVFVKNFCNILDELGIQHKDHVMLKSSSKVEKIARYLKFYVGTFFALLFEQYDLIYVHYASHSSIPVLLAHKLREKIVYTNVHGSDVVPQNLSQEKMQRYTKRIIKLSNKIIVPSDFFKEVVSEKYCVDRHKIFVSPSGGIDNTKFFMLDYNNEKTDILTLGFVSRIEQGKGLDILLKACSQLSVLYKLIIVGSGTEKNRMKELSMTLGIDKNIQWIDLQPQEKLRELYNKMDVFIFPSELQESLGLVAIEAMACGTPVIASDFAAPKYYIDEGVNGLKFECGNDKSLKEAIERFNKIDKDEKKMMVKGALETASRYNVSTIKEDMRRILEIK